MNGAYRRPYVTSTRSKADAGSAVLLAVRQSGGRVRVEKAIRQEAAWRLQIARTGDAALRALSARTFHVVLIDAAIPVVSAAELCRVIRNRAGIATVPLIVLEFDSRDSDREALAFAVGADDYIDATSSTSDVLDRIRTVVQRRTALIAPAGATVSHVYKDRHLAANFHDFFVSVDGRPLVMQRREFALLEYLVKRRNQLVTREDLLRDVWRGKRDVGSRTIDVHVCRLRRKLGAAGKQIQTLVSLGYRFVDPRSSAADRT